MRHAALLLVLFAGGSALLTNVHDALAAEDAKPAAKATRLFDGKTLDGWNVMNCEAEVRDGAMLLKSGNGLVQSKKTYGDFVLEFSWKALKSDRWDSGVYFRYKEVPQGRPWPSRYQTNLRQGMEGDVGRLKDARSTGLTKPGEWNHFKLTVVGTGAELQINGKPAWKADGLEEESGYLGIQAEVPLGGQFLFKDILITELGE